jgi:hypothetical protein
MQRSPPVKCLPFSIFITSQASSPLNCHSQATVSIQKPFCFSACVPSGVPVPFHEPISTFNSRRAVLAFFLAGASAARTRPRTHSTATKAANRFMFRPRSNSCAQDATPAGPVPRKYDAVSA